MTHCLDTYNAIRQSNINARLAICMYILAMESYILRSEYGDVKDVKRFYTSYKKEIPLIYEAGLSSFMADGIYGLFTIKSALVDLGTS